MKSEHKSISSLGEFGLIKHLTEKFQINHNSTLKGIGDDAAVINYAANMCSLVSTDLLLEGIHFDLTYVPLKHLGYKAVVVNLSDIYAMNGTPKQITVSLGISSKITLQMLEDFYEGIKLACDKYNVDLIGGDTTTSLTGFTISITAIGEADEKEITFRNGAKANDLICVTGDLGAAYIGLLLLEREKQVFQANPQMQPQFEGNEYVLERQLKPEAKKELKNLLKDFGVRPTAMIDVSDGLSSELLHICKESGKGCRVYTERIPIDVETGRIAEELNLNPITCAMNGGEDYEILFTVPIECHDLVRGNLNFTVIGHITEESEGKYLIGEGGHLIEIKAQGWNHFDEVK